MILHSSIFNHWFHHKIKTIHHLHNLKLINIEQLGFASPNHITLQNIIDQFQAPVQAQIQSFKISNHFFCIINENCWNWCMWIDDEFLKYWRNIQWKLKAEFFESWIFMKIRNIIHKVE
jgi:hypothetical protein